MYLKLPSVCFPIAYLSCFSKILFLLFVNIILVQFVVGAQTFDGDENLNGIVDNIENLSPLSNNIITTVNDCVRIGLIQTGIYNNMKSRLEDIGYTNISILQPDSDLPVLKQFDIIYLPSGWANGNVGSGDFDVIEQYSNDYLTYIAEGGRLFLEQPNPIVQTNNIVTPTVLPYPITFDYTYDSNDYPPEVLSPNHEIVAGITPEEMSYPADMMVSVDDNYEIIVMGSVTMSPSLAVTEYGEGKVLVSAANSSTTAFYPMSEEFYKSMIEWLGPATHTDLIISCDAFIWIDGNIYASDNNTASYILTNTDGCDSLVQLDLTISDPNVTITEDDLNLTVSEPNALYQWLDCNAGYTPIVGATEQIYTASSSGSFAVAVTLNGCMDTSLCVNVGMTQIEDLLLESVSVYPNPSYGPITIDFGILEKPTVKVYSVLGQLVFEKQAITDRFFEFDLSESAGVYFVEVSVDSNRKLYRILKE